MFNEMDDSACMTNLNEEALASKTTEGELLDLTYYGAQDVLAELQGASSSSSSGVDASMLDGTLDATLSEALVSFCASLPRSQGAMLRLAHNDLSTGSDCEQRIHELITERKVREAEKAFHEKKKSDSSKEKDFAAAAGMKRKAQENIDVAVARLSAIDTELQGLDARKAAAPWHQLFTAMKNVRWNTLSKLDLSDCCLHGTSLELLTHVLLELEQRGDGQRVTWLQLSGNDLGDIGMGTLSRFLKLSSCLQTLLCRNVGVTEKGVSELVAGLVSNKAVVLLDMRDNGLCLRSAAQAAIDGVQRFNKRVEVLL
mmetsp:Transcript_33818/g.79024  ORF Transcript_33818/g.79024 Transcript_33818/m.79024 type:complete len:313 (-) Transcript_33818:154-1092(-)|eukprot:CAMPEP_0178406398 /NCGR_PEP_ID=MMETSP0689_2-20121128/18892_1 /TAXON_ID=160604 /ORGANISM="Amphidinium massartii, Strain CS-259" /LENGTH=312 /DNA_ID=CAMNT_0020027439 /DNA_START=87 /DNA_END=1025 /DNA_ORIENTATION=-